MIITQPALLCLTSFWSRLAGRPEFPPAAPQPASAAGVPVMAASAPARPKRAAVVEQAVVQAAEPEQSARLASAPDASSVATEMAAAEVGEAQPAASPESAPLTANERRARAAALRALAFSRARRFDAAQAAFTDAARLDPALDLTRVPSFWSLERSAHEAAIAAYVAADRAGDAAVLRARVHSVYRPKPLRVRPAAAATS